MQHLAAQPLVEWFNTLGWQPFQFQRQTWQAYLSGESGLIHAATGTGKTLAAWGGPLLEAMAEKNAHAQDNSPSPPAALPEGEGSLPLRVLWLTPLRALANDTAETLARPVNDLNLPWTIGLRTGDTSQAVRRKQNERLPTALITTPESLSLLLSQKHAARRFANLRCVVVDEWHELLSSKRGVQAELCLARLKSIAPGLRIWGLSATLGNLDQALFTLLGSNHVPDGRLISGEQPKRTTIETLFPDSIDRFPWAGHLGLRLLPQVIEQIASANSTLLFTNTRSQAELWFRALMRNVPDEFGRIAIHHGSIDHDLRLRIEALLRGGRMKCVVCTSSLDLGVDFSPVDQVIQVGSPKGIARMMQRAGRSGHQPGSLSRIVLVPTNALELVEFSAARHAAEAGLIEARQPIDRPLDVLAQHLVTVAMGDGFDEQAMLEEIRRTAAFHQLTSEEWQWMLDFITRGGPALTAYPHYAKAVNDNGTYRVQSQKIARLHRMSIGTITADSSMRVRFVGGRSLGTIEESFISRLRPGDRFVFAGRPLELVRVREMTAFVRRARSSSGAVPRWMGGRSPLSTQLAASVRYRLDQARAGDFADREMMELQPLLALQQKWSTIPAADELLIEQTTVRRRHHTFIFAFAGRLAHEGLAALVAYRIANRQPTSLNVTANDYGFELLTRRRLELTEHQWRDILSPDHLVDDLLACLNSSELTRRRFRDIARVAGLLFQGYPGQGKPMRHLQASSDLFFEVFSDFDPTNLLLDQARREVLDRELEIVRMRSALQRLADYRLTNIQTERLSPLAFPLWAERLRTQQISSESWSQRIAQMIEELEQHADDEQSDYDKRQSSRSRESTISAPQ